MAKYTITCSCGHEYTFNICGPVRDRDRKAEWLAGQDCPKCRAAAERKAAEEAAAKAAAAEADKAVTLDTVKRELLAAIAEEIKRTPVDKVKAAMIDSYGVAGKIADEMLVKTLTSPGWGYSIRPETDADAVRSSHNARAARELVETAMAFFPLD